MEQKIVESAKEMHLNLLIIRICFIVAISVVVIALVNVGLIVAAVTIVDDVSVDTSDSNQTVF